MSLKKQVSSFQCGRKLEIVILLGDSETKRQIQKEPRCLSFPIPMLVRLLLMFWDLAHVFLNVWALAMLKSMEW